MTAAFRPLRFLLLVAGSLFAFPLAHAGHVGQRLYLDLPEFTTAIDHGHQVNIAVVLRLNDTRREKQVRENLVRLRHALVLDLAEQNLETPAGDRIESFLEEYRRDANAMLGGRNAIAAVLVRRFVVQGK